MELLLGYSPSQSSEPGAWWSDTGGGSSYEASHQTVRVFWRQQACPRWADTPMLPKGACFLSWNIVVYTVFLASWWTDGWDVMIWISPPPQCIILKDPKADDPTHGLSMASPHCFLIPAQTSWSSQTQLGKGIVFKQRVNQNFLFQCFLIDSKLNPSFWIMPPLKQLFLILYF